MIPPRWRKILNDLWSNRSRTLLVALSIAVGVFAVGGIASTYFVMREDVQKDFLSANPHDSMIYTSWFDDDLLATVRHLPGVAQAEGRSSTYAKITIPGEQKVDISFDGIRSLEEVKIDQLRLLSGSPTIQDKEVYIDRGSIDALGVKEGEKITVELRDGKLRELRVIGVVHDVYANPFGASRTVAAYVNMDTLIWLYGQRYYDRLIFTTTGGPHTEEYIREVSNRVSDQIRKSGGEVYVTLIFKPGEHPGQATVDSSMALLGGMGVLALFLSTFLVINTIAALLNQQVRQIGVMKAIGGSTGQVTVMYLVLVLLFGVLAELVSIPLAGWAGYVSSEYFASALLNSMLSGFRIPTPALVLMIIVGLAVPLFAGVVPVMNGVRKTVREAISDYGLSALGSRSLFDRVLESVRGLPRPLMISLRNTFRRKGRLALTLSTLALGGAIFIAVFNLQEAMMIEIDKTFGYILSDVNVSFSHGYRIDRVKDAVAGLPGLVSIESWGGATGQVMQADGKTGDEIQIVAPPAGSQLIKATITSGRWLVKEDDNAVVVGNHFIKVRPDVKVGDVITVRIGDEDHPFTVVGVYQMAGTIIPPLLYTNAEYLAKIQGGPPMMYFGRVLTDDHTPAGQRKMGDMLKARFEEAGISISSVQTGTEIAEQSGFAINILIYVLLVMAVLIAIVGGLGLMGTMGMNVMERTREIGVMRSLGAVDTSIMQLVVVEGMIIGLVSWALGALLSVPITYGMNYILGLTLLNVPMNYAFNPAGLIIWVIVVIILSALASVLPARNAVRLTVRDILAYE